MRSNMNRLSSRGRGRRSAGDGDNDNDSLSDNSTRSSSRLRGKFNMKRGSRKTEELVDDDRDSDSVSEFSIGSARSSASKYESVRSQFKRAGAKLKRGTSRSRGKKEVVDDGDSDSVSAYSMGSTYSDVSKYKAIRSKIKEAGSKMVGKKKRDHPPSFLDVNESDQLVGATVVSQSDEDAAHAKHNLMKNAKSRFNIGIVYLKTGDYAKARENLEHSLKCHTQLEGDDVSCYTRETSFAMAAVHEKLGDCYSANSEIADKSIAVGHYQESRKLLQLVDHEDASDDALEMLERVDDQLKSPELSHVQGQQPPVVQLSNVTAHQSASSPRSPDAVEKPTFDAQLNQPLSYESMSDSDAEMLASAMLHLDRNNHQMAFDQLSSMQVMESMNNSHFLEGLISNMMTVASSALEAGKTSVAVDAFEAAYAQLKSLQVKSAPPPSRWELLKKNKRQSSMSMIKLNLVAKTELNSSSRSVSSTVSRDVCADLALAMRGCIKSHKALALEMESMMDYESAIEQRMRVKELLEENEQYIPVCNQLLKIAYLYGEKNHNYEKCTSTLADLAQKLSSSSSLDSMPVERTNLLVQCYHMGAISFSKTNKWNEAVQQYDALLPLLAKTKGRECPEYNAASIQKAALLVKTGHYDHALTTIIKYFDLEEKSTEKMIVDSTDHILAIDVYTSLLLDAGNVDKAKDLLEKKLAFLDRLPKNDEMKSDTMHKLGCLLAFKKEHQLAMPFFNEALDSRKRLYDGRHKAVFESTWAVATTAQSMGDTDKSLNAYSELVSKKAITEDLPVDIIRIHNSAGKLFFEDGYTEKSVDSFRQALLEAVTRQNDEQKHIAELNLANALSSVGVSDEAMELYEGIVSKKELKLSKIFFMALVNKSALLLKMGQVEEACEILCDIEETDSANADDVRGRVYLMLGNVAVLNGQRKEAQSYFEKSLTAAGDDLNTLVQAKKSMGHAFLLAGQYDKAISTLDDLLEEISFRGGERKSARNLFKADIWNCMARVYKMQGNLSQAKNFAKLALQTFKSVLGETHPITLRNVSNLQLLLLEEAEGMDKSESKFLMDVAKYEIEDTLDSFESLKDPTSHRLTIASLRTNLGFVAVWQGKPKKARKYLRQIKEVEIPSDHLLLRRIAMLEECVLQMEKRGLYQ